MSKQKAKKNGELEVTETSTVVVTTMTLQELIGKKAEIQTRIDHLNVDLTVVQAEMIVIDSDIVLIS